MDPLIFTLLNVMNIIVMKIIIYLLFLRERVMLVRKVEFVKLLLKGIIKGKELKFIYFIKF